MEAIGFSFVDGVIIARSVSYVTEVMPVCFALTVKYADHNMCLSLSLLGIGAYWWFNRTPYNKKFDSTVIKVMASNNIQRSNSMSDSGFVAKMKMSVSYLLLIRSSA